MPFFCYTEKFFAAFFVSEKLFVPFLSMLEIFGYFCANWNFFASFFVVVGIFCVIFLL